MNRKKFLLAWVVAFIVWFGGAYVINALLIDYSAIAHLNRPWEEELKRFPLLILADLLLMGAFVALYRRGIRTGSWVGEGVRFGILATVVSPFSLYVRVYVAQDVPVSMLVQQLSCFLLLTVLIGLIIAFIHRADGKVSGT